MGLFLLMFTDNDNVESTANLEKNCKYSKNNLFPDQKLRL